MFTSKFALRNSMFAIVSMGVMFGATAEPSTDAAPGSLEAALASTKPILNTRLRLETADQDGFSETATALTYRIRAGLETGAFLDTKFLVEFEHIGDLVDDYNSTINGKTAYPVIPDPEVTELNRLQLTNTSLPDTTTTIGRQVLAIDDHRFIGHVGWRQNQQTFDSIRFQNASFGSLAVDAGYITQVNRIFGDDSPMGRWDGDSYFFNASHPTPIGKVTGFAYMIDVDQAGGVFSSQTFGARLAGAEDLSGGSLAYALSYAKQSDYGSSNLDYSTDYYLAEVAYNSGTWMIGAGYEMLGGDSQQGFQTPLATLHKFQGWADKFLVTPVAGVEDLYAKAGYKLGDIGELTGVNFMAVYHDFSADTISSNYGSEIDLQASATWKNLGLTLKFADYQANDFSTDTQKFWFEVSWGL